MQLGMGIYGEAGGGDYSSRSAVRMFDPPSRRCHTVHSQFDMGTADLPRNIRPLASGDRRRVL